MSNDAVAGNDFNIATGEAKEFSCQPGDRLRLTNQTGAVMLIVVLGKASGSEIRIDVPQEGVVQITVGTENVAVTLKGDEADALSPILVH